MQFFCLYVCLVSLFAGKLAHASFQQIKCCPCPDNGKYIKLSSFFEDDDYEITDTTPELDEKLKNYPLDESAHDLNEDQKEILQMHNFYRQQVVKGEVTDQPKTKKIKDLVKYHQHFA